MSEFTLTDQAGNEVDVKRSKSWGRFFALILLVLISNFFVFSSIGAVLNVNPDLGEYVFIVQSVIFVFASFLLFRFEFFKFSGVMDMYGKQGKQTNSSFVRRFLLFLLMFAFVLEPNRRIWWEDLSGLLSFEKHLENFGGFSKLDFETTYFVLYLLLVLFMLVWSFLLYKIQLSKGNVLEVLYVKIVGLLMAYVMVAIYFSTIWIFVVIGDPSALNGSIEKSMHAIYFSFVTLTTLGYGDYYPISHSAMFYAIIEVVIGVFFVSLIVGFSIGYTLAVMDDLRVKRRSYLSRPKV